MDGSVKLDQHAVPVGPDGEFQADIVARVDGDISAPRVVLEDGAQLRGLVDMDQPP